jgi:hypothetical protein
MQLKLEESNARDEIQVRQTSMRNSEVRNLLCQNTTSPATAFHPFIFCITTHNQTLLLVTRNMCPSVCLGSGNMQCANKTVDAPKRGANTFATRGRGLSEALCLAVSAMGRIQFLGCCCTKPWVLKFASGAVLDKYLRSMFVDCCCSCCASAYVQVCGWAQNHFLPTMLAYSFAALATIPTLLRNCQSLICISSISMLA